MSGGEYQAAYISALECLICNETVLSLERHTMVACECRNVAADGGFAYFKASVKEPDKMRVRKIRIK